jgi:uncharacterized protein with GYD domain
VLIVGAIDDYLPGSRLRIAEVSDAEVSRVRVVFSRRRQGLRQDGGTKRREVAGHAVESVGGKIEAFYFCFGDQDADHHRGPARHAAAAAVSLAVRRPAPPG